MDAQVAIRHAQQIFEFVERERRIDCQGADDSEPDTLVNQAVKTRRLGRGRTRSRSSLFVFFLPLTAE